MLALGKSMFKNSDIQRAASQNGYAVIDANLHNEVEQFYTYISNHFKFDTTDFYYSLMSNSFETNKIVQSTLLEILHRFFEAHFTSYKIINASFLVKPADTKEEFLLHQDWCYTDEKRFNAYNIWIPLADVTAHNGAMFFLPGSHLWFNNFRSGSFHSSKVESTNALQPYVHTVPLQKGQVVMFNPAVFHGSHPNCSAHNRLVVTATILPQEAPFLYYHRSDAENTAGVFEMDEEAFLQDLEKLAYGGVPQSPEVTKLSYTHKTITEKDLMERLLNFEASSHHLTIA